VTPLTARAASLSPTDSSESGILDVRDGSRPRVPQGKLAMTQPPTRTARPAMRPARDGMTLIELMLVVTIMAIVAGIAIPRLDFIRYRSDAAARGVIGQLQAAQRLAVTRQYDVLVSFDVANRRVRVLEDVNNNGRADAGERAQWRSLQEQTLFSAPTTPVSMSGGAVVGRDLRTIDGMPTITFRRDGSASGDAEIYLTSPRLRPSDQRAVLVTESTGRAEWMRYNGSGWIRGGI